MREETRKFLDPANTALNLILDPKKLAEINDSIITKPIRQTQGVALSTAIAVTTYQNNNLSQNFSNNAANITELYSADSMTKMLTAAIILRMTETSSYTDFLPDGIETKLIALLPLLQKHFPDSNYLKNELTTEPDLAEITIADLALHRSGLARVKRQSLDEAIIEHGKLSNDQMIDTEKLAKTGCFGEKHGEYFYNDLGYELLGRIAIAIASDVKEYPVNYSEILNELVLARVREKLPENERDSLIFFSSEQMVDIAAATKVVDNPEFSVIYGQHFYQGENHLVASHLYDLACGGGYTNPDSMSKIAFHLLHSKGQYSIYQKPETLEIFNSTNTAKLNSDGAVEIPAKIYGFGYETYTDPNYQCYRDHGGLGYGSNSNVIIDTNNNRSVAVMLAFENLTLPIAYNLIHAENAKEEIRLNSELYDKILELRDNFSEAELISLRNSLDNISQKQNSTEYIYNKGLDPTTAEFSAYINNSNDWANIGQEIKYFIQLSKSEYDYEKIDSKGYILTCMFKILSAIAEYDQQKKDQAGNLLRTIDPRDNIDPEVREFLGRDLSFNALKQHILTYGQNIIHDHQNEINAHSLSAVASVYGVRAYMLHQGLVSEEEIITELEPKKYAKDKELNNIEKNIIIATEIFEQSAVLGNVRSMGSVLTWAERVSDKIGEDKLEELNEKWIRRAATAKTANPNSQIDYAKNLEKKGDLAQAQEFLEKAVNYNLDKADRKLNEFLARHQIAADKSLKKLSDHLQKNSEGSYAEKIAAEKQTMPANTTFLEREKAKDKSLKKLSDHLQKNSEGSYAEKIAAEKQTMPANTTFLEREKAKTSSKGGIDFT